MKRKYESPQSESVELKISYRLLAGSETEPEPHPSGEGTPDD